MGGEILQKLARAVWALAHHQQGVVSRRQLLELGATPKWIEHRIAKGRLHPVHRGVYAVGRPQLTLEGRLMAAVLASGRDAWLSHQSAARLWRILRELRHGHARPEPIHVSLHAAVFRQPPGILVHRTATLGAEDRTIHRGIPVTTPVRTMIDLATTLPPARLEAAVNEAFILDLTDPESLRIVLDERKADAASPPSEPSSTATPFA